MPWLVGSTSTHNPLMITPYDWDVFRPGSRCSNRRDVELKFAMRMRETWQVTGVAAKENIVINHPNGPCEGELGCNDLLPSFLPPKSELTVHWPGGGQRTYRGTRLYELQREGILQTRSRDQPCCRPHR